MTASQPGRILNTWPRMKNLILAYTITVTLRFEARSTLESDGQQAATVNLPQVLLLGGLALWHSAGAPAPAGLGTFKFLETTHLTGILRIPLH